MIAFIWKVTKNNNGIKKGYVIQHLHKVWHSQETSTELFKEYVNTFLKIKQEASGWPKEVGIDPEKRHPYVQEYLLGEGISPDPSKIERNTCSNLTERKWTFFPILALFVDLL